MSELTTLEYDTVPSDFARHDCAVQPTMNLQWKVGPYYPMLQDSRKLEQAFICCVCGKYEWREVPEVKEGAK